MFYKKLLMPLVILLIIGGIVSSCDEYKPYNYNPVPFEEQNLLEGNNYSKSYDTINVDELKQMIEDEKTFILYLGQSSCPSCIAFSPIYTQFVIENNVVLYYIEPSNELRAANIFPFQYTPTLISFHEGEVMDVVSPVEDGEPFFSTESLGIFINKYAKLPVIKEIDEAELDELILDNEEFIIYYTTNNCEECTLVNENVLLNYQKEHQDIESIYYITVSNLNDNEVWLNFAAKYGLDTYLSGKVPTFQYRNGATILETAVYLNEELETLKDENNNLLGVKVIDSFYDDFPYIGESYSDYYSYKEAATVFHDQKLISFLDRNIQLID